MRNGKWETTRYPGIRRTRSTTTTSGYRYQVMYRDGAGAKRAKQVPTLDEARTFQNNLGVAKAAGALPDLAKGEITVRQLLAEVEATKTYSHSRLGTHRVCIAKLGAVADTRLRDVTEAKLDAVLRREKKPAMNATLRSFVAMLFRFALAKKYITLSPMPVEVKSTTRADRRQSKPSKDRPKKYLTDAAFDALVAATPAQWKAAIVLGGRMGLRPGEVFGLTVGRFTPATEVPARSRAKLVIDTTISEEHDTKTGEHRTLPLPREVATILAAHIDAHTDGASDTPLFANERGLGITTKNAFDAWRNRQWSKIRDAAGLDADYTPNDLRHSAASYAIRHGANVYHVQKMLGHAKASITLDTYGELWDESLDELMDDLDTAMNRTA